MRGTRRVGKTSTVVQVLHYAYERNHFDGIYFIDLEEEKEGHLDILGRLIHKIMSLDKNEN